MALTETWLSADIANQELFSDNFSVWRKDRNFQAIGLSRGGGVLLAIRKCFRMSVLDLTVLTNVVVSVDVVGVLADFGNLRKTLILVLYIPPNTSYQDFELFFDLISNYLTSFNNTVIMFIGDFNVPLFGKVTKNNYTVCLDGLSNVFNLRQFNTIGNIRLLDLVFCSIDCIVANSESPLVPEDAFHPALLINFTSFRKEPKSFDLNVDDVKYNFKKANLHTYIVV